MASISSEVSFTAGVAKRWGILVLAAVTLFSLRRVCLEPTSAHYLLFTRTAEAFWHGKPAFGTDQGTGIGLWFYSPFCGMFFFRPFSLLPDQIGMALYLFVSLALFALGAHRLVRAIRADTRIRELFYALCAAPILSAVVTTKLEIAITGILMLAASFLIEGQLVWLAGVLIALVANWKLLAGPTILLWALVLLKGGGFRRFLLGLVLGLALAYGLPYLFVPATYLFHEEGVWRATLSAFSRESLFHFENVFCFVKFAFGVETPWAVAQSVSALAGLGFAAFLMMWMRRAPRATFLARGILLASALGAAFAMAFSPLGQNNGLILTAPLLLWFSELAYWRLDCIRAQTLWIAALAITLVVPYSDLVPLPARDYLHALSIKQMLLLAATLFGVYLELHTPVAGKIVKSDHG